MRLSTYSLPKAHCLPKLSEPRLIISSGQWVSAFCGPSLTRILTSWVKLQPRYCSLYPMDKEVQIMIDRAIQIVDPLAEASWAIDCLPLMPTHQGEVCCQPEARRRAEANQETAEERWQAIWPRQPSMPLGPHLTPQSLESKSLQATSFRVSTYVSPKTSRSRLLLSARQFSSFKRATTLLCWKGFMKPARGSSGTSRLHYEPAYD